jgi:hypothetical protein
MYRSPGCERSGVTAEVVAITPLDAILREGLMDGAASVNEKQLENGEPEKRRPGRDFRGSSTVGCISPRMAEGPKVDGRRCARVGRLCPPSSILGAHILLEARSVSCVVRAWGSRSWVGAWELGERGFELGLTALIIPGFVNVLKTISSRGGPRAAQPRSVWCAGVAGASVSG